MAYGSEVKVSITVQDTAPATPELKARREKSDNLSDLHEFMELVLTVPNTVLNSTFSNGKPIVFDTPKLEPKQIVIVSDGPIGVVQYMTTPQPLFMQPCRSILVLTYEEDDPPTEIRLMNLNADPVKVKVFVTSKNVNL
jgi:hypothetical protein